LVCHIFCPFIQSRTPGRPSGMTAATSRAFHHNAQRSRVCTQPEGVGARWKP